MASYKVDIKLVCAGPCGMFMGLEQVEITHPWEDIKENKYVMYDFVLCPMCEARMNEDMIEGISQLLRGFNGED